MITKDLRVDFDNKKEYVKNLLNTQIVLNESINELKNIQDNQDVINKFDEINSKVYSNIELLENLSELFKIGLFDKNVDEVKYTNAINSYNSNLDTIINNIALYKQELQFLKETIETNKIALYFNPKKEDKSEKLEEGLDNFLDENIGSSVENVAADVLDAVYSSNQIVNDLKEFDINEEIKNATEQLKDEVVVEENKEEQHEIVEDEHEDLVEESKEINDAYNKEEIEQSNQENENNHKNTKETIVDFISNNDTYKGKFTKKNENEIEKMLGVFSEKDSKLLFTVEDNSLIISPRDNIIIFPFEKIQVILAYDIYKSKYSSIDEYIYDNYSSSYSSYKNNWFNRVREMYRLEKRSLFTIGSPIKKYIQAILNKNLHPAVIASCYNISELQDYYNCYKSGTMENFTAFKVYLK